MNACPLSYEQIREIVSRVTYKPGITFTVMRLTALSYDFGLNAKLLDVTNPQQLTVITLYRRVHVDTIRTRHDVLEILRRELIDQFEQHESDEWFQVNGQVVSWPHAHDRPRVHEHTR